MIDVSNVHKIKKEKMCIAILTHDYRIEGCVHLPPNSRLTDYINSKTGGEFIAVTDAEIISLDKNTVISKIDYLAVNKSYITLVYPLATV